MGREGKGRKREGKGGEIKKKEGQGIEGNGREGEGREWKGRKGNVRGKKRKLFFSNINLYFLHVNDMFFLSSIDRSYQK